MEDHEIADVLELVLRLRVIFVHFGGLEAAPGEQIERLGDAGLDQVDAGRLERLQEAARESERDTFGSKPSRRPVVKGK